MCTFIIKTKYTNSSKYKTIKKTRNYYYNKTYNFYIKRRKLPNSKCSQCSATVICSLIKVLMYKYYLITERFSFFPPYNKSINYKLTEE